MIRRTLHVAKLLRTSEDRDGNVTGEQEIRVTYGFTPPRDATLLSPAEDAAIDVTLVEIELLPETGRSVARGVQWTPAPTCKQRGDFDFTEYAESRADDLAAEAMADLDRWRERWAELRA